MQTLIREYGEAILAAIVMALIIGLVFAGLMLFGKMDIITGRIDDPLLQEAEASSETALKGHLDIEALNIDMSSDTEVVCGRQYFYKGRDRRLIGIRDGSVRTIHINHIYMLIGKEDNDGYEVTDQVHVMTGDEPYLVFQVPGSYRLIVDVTDSHGIVSDYQIFVTAVERRDV